MSDIQASLSTVMKRFPDRHAEIKSCFAQNDTFKAICEDFRQCQESLRHWNCAEMEDVEQRWLEYRVLLMELEVEILKHLNGNY